MKRTDQKRNLFLFTIPLLFLFLGIAQRSSALDPDKAITQYSLDFWNTASGLPQGSVQALAQTSDGYLWLGTRAGLVRFNGADFELFEPATGAGLDGRDIRSLFAGRDGSLWIGTDGRGITRRHQGVFQRLGGSDAFLGDSGNALYEDSAGVLWAGTWAGLLRYDGAHVSRLRHADGLPHDSVIGIAGDGEALWVATTTSISRLKQGRFTATRELQDGEGRCLLRDRRGILWIGTADGLESQHAGIRTRYTVADGLLGNLVSALAEDRDGNLWIGTDGGLNRWSDGRFDSFSVADGMPGNSVSALLEDQEGNLWIGLQGTGLARLRDGSLRTYATQEGLPGDRVQAIFESRDGDLWIGTSHGLARFDGERFEVLTKRDGLANDTVLGLGEIDGSGVVIATLAPSLTVFENGSLKIFESIPPSAAAPSVPFQDSRGRVWVGTLGAGIYRWHDGDLEHYRFPDDDGSHVVHAALEGRDGSIFFATANGLLRFNEDGFERLLVYRLSAASRGVLYSMHQSSDGTLWLATRDRGICRFRAGRVQRCYSRLDGLPEDSVYQVLEDDIGRLWLCGPRGLFTVNRRELDALDNGQIERLSQATYGIDDGMKSAECTHSRSPAAWRSRDGRLWFATAKGAVVVDPGDLRHNDLPPPVSVERVAVDGRVFADLGDITAEPGRGDLEIAYAGLSFVAPDQVLFRYRLEGYDADWVAAGNRRIARYTKIPPGRYRFRVIASNNDGVWNERGAAVDIELEPHFYQTGWWYAALGAAALGLVASWHFSRVHRLKRRQQDLATGIAQALAEVRTLSGMLPICSSCKRVRDDEGYWQQIEAYITERSEADFSHGVCPSCIRDLFPDLAHEVLTEPATGRDGTGREN